MIRTLIILAIVVVVAIILYNAFKGKSSTSTTQSQCPNTFAIRSGIGGLETITYSNQNGTYYKQISGGLGGFSGTLPPQQIQQADFLAACKAYMTPASTSTNSTT